MKELRRLSSVIVLTLLLGLSTFAGQALACTDSIPGQIGTPCVPTPSANQSIEPGTEASRAVTVNEFDFSVGEVASSLLRKAFLLF